MTVELHNALWNFVSLTATLLATPVAAQEISSAADLRAAIARARPNSRVSIPAGTYNIGSTPLRIEEKRNVEIVGAGEGRTIIRASASAPYIFELAGSNDGLTVANMTLEGLPGYPRTRMRLRADLIE